jgi:hypothetical protein
MAVVACDDGTNNDTKVTKGSKDTKKSYEISFVCVVPFVSFVRMS